MSNNLRLIQEIQTLQASLSTLQTNCYSTLRADHETLRTDHDSLKASHDELVQRVAQVERTQAVRINSVLYRDAKLTPVVENNPR
jgi:hypothetical protein